MKFIRIKRKKQEGWSGKGFIPRCRCNICKGEKAIRIGEEEPQTVRVLAMLRSRESLSPSWKNPSSCMKSQVLVPACYLVID